MVRFIEKNKALKLRKKGRSINEISAKLNIAKSTVSSWCRNIQLGPEQIERLAKRQESGSYKGRMKFLERIRKERIKEVALLRKQGIKEIGKLSKRDLFIAGVAMYWSEGYTYSGGEQVGFTNSDPKMILLMLRWFKEICKVSDDDISLQVKINETHKDRTKEVENYWSDLTKIPVGQFNKTVLIKSKTKKIYSNYNNYYGTLRITVRQGTQLRRRIHGWIEGLAKGIK
ncbi:helix-turn-helix domain-containing protein [bacterium]|nr:helix-turn-helix domain-containing protein [bacterium]